MLVVEDLARRYLWLNYFHIRTGTFFLGLFQLIYTFFILITVPLWSINSDQVEQSAWVNYVGVMMLFQWEHFIVQIHPSQFVISSFNYFPNSSSSSYFNEIYGTTMKISEFDPISFRIFTVNDYTCTRFVLTALSFICAFLLLLGVLKKEGPFLIPYFIFQCIDYVFTQLSIMAFFFGLPHSIARFEKNPQIAVLVAVLAVVILICKLILIYMVLLCYEFLTFFALTLGFLMDNSIVATWIRMLDSLTRSRSDPLFNISHLFGSSSFRSPGDSQPPTFVEAVQMPSTSSAIPVRTSIQRLPPSSTSQIQHN